MGHVCRLADDEGFYRLGMPKAVGGKDASLLTSDLIHSLARECAGVLNFLDAVAIIREHFNAKGIGLHNDAQSEHSIVGNVPLALVVLDAGTDAQKAELCPKLLSGEYRMSFGLTVSLQPQ